MASHLVVETRTRTGWQRHSRGVWESRIASAKVGDERGSACEPEQTMPAE
jgi:hypothetical protein